MTIKTTLLAAASALILSAAASVAAVAAPAVAQSPVNMRAGPGPQYEVLATVPGGATVDVAGCTGSWCQISYAGESGYANRNYLALAGEFAPSAGVAVVPGYAYDDTPLYSDDYYGYGYAYGPSFGFYANPGHRFRHGWSGRPGWNGNQAGNWQGRGGNWQGRFTPSGVNRSAIGGRPSVSAPVGMSTGGGSAAGVFRGGSGAFRGGGTQIGGGAAIGGAAVGGGGAVRGQAR